MAKKDGFYKKKYLNRDFFKKKCFNSGYFVV